MTFSSNHQHSGHPVSPAIIIVVIALIVFGLISQLFFADKPEKQAPAAVSDESRSTDQIQ